MLSFVRQTPPTYRPPQYTGLPAQAAAGVGQALTGLGRGVAEWGRRRRDRADWLAASRAWRALDEWQHRYLRALPQRQQELARTGVDPVTGASTTGYERELDAYPQAVRAEFQRLAAELAPSARALFEQRYNDRAAQWADVTVGTLESLELQNVAGEIQGLAAADRTADAELLLQQYRDRLSPADVTRLRQAIAEASLAARRASAEDYLQNVAASSGWEAAGALLQDPAWQQTMGLDLPEASEIKTDLDKFVRAQRQREQDERAAARQQAHDRLLADAREGTLEVGGLWQRVRRDEIDHAVAEQAYRIYTQPVPRSDPDIYMELQRRISAARTDPGQRPAALAYARGHASHLSASDFQGAVDAIEKAGDPDDPLSTPRSRLLGQLVDEHYEQGTFGAWGTTEAQLGYLDAKERLWTWIRAHPEASDAEANAFLQQLLAPTRQGGWLRWMKENWLLGSWWHRPVLGWGIKWWEGVQDELEGIGIGSAPVLEQAFTSTEPAPTYERPPNVYEPATREEFEETVRSLILTDEAAASDYYEKWRHKWQ